MTDLKRNALLLAIAETLQDIARENSITINNGDDGLPILIHKQPGSPDVSIELCLVPF